MLGESKAQTTAVMTEDELWQLAFKKLLVWTVKRHRMNAADAEETVQEAIRLFIKRGGKADPANPKALLEALGSNINGIAVNRRRKKAELAVALTSDGEPAELDDPPNVEQRIVNDDLTRRAVSTLLERVADDELATAIVMQMIDGVDEPAEQAMAIGRRIGEVYNARRRLKTHVEAVQKLMETW